MKIRKDHTLTTDVYVVEDGTLEETAPGHLTQGIFRVEYLSVTYLNGELEKVYIKGPGLMANGQLGKSIRVRTYTSDFPYWVIDFLHK